MTDRIRFGLVEAGGRSDFFLRIVRQMPKHFEVVCAQVRDPVKGKAYADWWQLPVVNALPELLEREEPEFVLVSVSQPAAAEVIASVASTGMPVLTETPPGQTVAELERLTALTRNGAHIQVAELYPFQPLHAARLTLAHDGRRDDITQAQVSAAHRYHGDSLMRLMLGVDFEGAMIHAFGVESRLLASHRRTGRLVAGKLEDSHQILALFEFDSVQSGLFDFTWDQYWSWARAPRVLIRGTRGEIVRDRIAWLRDSQTPMSLPLERVDGGRLGFLEDIATTGFRSAKSGCIAIRRYRRGCPTTKSPRWTVCCAWVRTCVQAVASTTSRRVRRTST
ncbi:MAG: Gfo/Idh/MocA family oxidoreductase [Caldilineaceae bacterium]|nr:Gfo/Idh/MocA family oxidoreductase [Caldilineaceae bacterium]